MCSWVSFMMSVPELTVGTVGVPVIAGLSSLEKVRDFDLTDGNDIPGSIMGFPVNESECLRISSLNKIRGGSLLGQSSVCFKNLILATWKPFSQ